MKDPGFWQPLRTGCPLPRAPLSYRRSRENAGSRICRIVSWLSPDQVLGRCAMPSRFRSIDTISLGGIRTAPILAAMTTARARSSIRVHNPKWNLISDKRHAAAETGSRCSQFSTSVVPAVFKFHHSFWLKQSCRPRRDGIGRDQFKPLHNARSWTDDQPVIDHKDAILANRFNRFPADPLFDFVRTNPA